MAVLLGFVVAVSYGSADFLGGRATRGSGSGPALLLTQAFGLIAAVVAAFVIGADELGSHDALLSAAAGLTAVGGLACLYRGLAIGRASVVAPISAVGAAVVQVSWGLGNGEDPGTVALVGVVIALVAVALVASTGGDPDEHRASTAVEVLFGVGAAIGLGFNLILFSETSTDSGLWPVVLARVVAVVFVGAALVVARRGLSVRREDVPVVAGGGLLDATATALLLVAVREGLLSLVAPVAALYPGSTVVLARVVDGERIGRLRIAGLCLALVGLALIAIR